MTRDLHNVNRILELEKRYKSLAETHERLLMERVLLLKLLHQVDEQLKPWNGDPLKVTKHDLRDTLDEARELYPHLFVEGV